MEYGKAIKAIRSLRGLSQVELSVKAKVSKSYLSKLESGQSVASMDKLEKIANALKVPFYMLVLIASEKSDLKGIPDNVANELKDNLLSLVMKPHRA